MESAREYNLYFLVGNGPSSVSTKRIVTVGNLWRVSCANGTRIHGTWTDNNNSGSYEFDGAAVPRVKAAENQIACPYWQ
jgi:hypothetical protein